MKSHSEFLLRSDFNRDIKVNRANETAVRFIPSYNPKSDFKTADSGITRTLEATYKLRENNTEESVIKYFNDILAHYTEEKCDAQEKTGAQEIFNAQENYFETKNIKFEQQENNEKFYFVKSEYKKKDSKKVENTPVETREVYEILTPKVHGKELVKVQNTPVESKRIYQISSPSVYKKEQKNNVTSKVPSPYTCRVTIESAVKPNVGRNENSLERHSSTEKNNLVIYRSAERNSLEKYTSDGRNSLEKTSPGGKNTYNMKKTVSLERYNPRETKYGSIKANSMKEYTIDLFKTTTDQTSSVKRTDSKPISNNGELRDANTKEILAVSRDIDKMIRQDVRRDHVVSNNINIYSGDFLKRNSREIQPSAELVYSTVRGFDSFMLY